MDSKEDSLQHLTWKGKERKEHYLPGAMWDELWKLCVGGDSCMYVLIE